MIGECSKIDLETSLEGRNVISRNVVLRNCDIGLATYISNNCELFFTKIGRFCSIGQRVKTILGIHPTSKFVRAHPAFFSTKKQAGFTFVEENRFEERKFVDTDLSIIIGNDVWIGCDVRIFEGVTIGNGAVVGSGTLVVKDVPPYSIVVGVSGKIISHRFDKEIIDKLINIKWWNWEFPKIEKLNIDFSD